MLVSVKARTGYDLEFQVLTERGVLRDKLPISALKTRVSESSLDQDDLQRWCCPSYYLTITKLPLQSGFAWICGDRMAFQYMFTVDFAPGLEVDPGSDVEIPEEHKAMHIIFSLGSSDIDRREPTAKREPRIRCTKTGLQCRTLSMCEKKRCQR
jgi:hypothetical protein